MARKGQKFKKYTEVFRTRVIEEHINVGKSKRFLSEKYDVPKGTINTWIYQYKHNGPTRRKRGRQKQSEEINYKEKYEILKKFLESLEEVEHEKK